MSALFSAVQFLDGCPHCPHGPMLAKSSNPVSFVCTAFRRKGDCARDAQSTRELPPTQSSLVELQSVEPEKRAYCFDCDHLFVSSSSDKRHASHQVSLGITDQLLRMPSFLLRPMTNSHSHSQYFFSLDTLNHLYSIMHQLDVRFVICVGTPRLHEFVQLQRSCRQQSMNSYLLDMDFRLQWFYSPNQFSSPGRTYENCLVFCDPPFAAPMVLVLDNLSKLGSYLLSGNIGCGNKTGTHLFCRTMLVLPHFFDRKLAKLNPNFSLLDYKITYTNHARFDCDDTTSPKIRGRRRDSVVRIFTNLPPSLVAPPPQLTAEFRYCKPCARYSFRNNIHCSHCNRCPTKHGQTYVHCHHCGRCRPPGRAHCFECGRCVPAYTSAFLLIVLLNVNWLSNVFSSSRQNLSGVFVIGKNASLPIRAPIHCTYSTCFDASLCAYEHSGRSLNRISVYVYNPTIYFDEFHRPLPLYPSDEQIDILIAIRNSRYSVDDPHKACVFVPNVDLLNGLNPNDRLARLTLSGLPWWNGGVNHLLFSFLPGKHNVFSGLAINANAAHSTGTYRSTFDISIPAFHPSFPIIGFRIDHTKRSFLLSVLPSYSASDRIRVKDILFAYRKPDFPENQSIILFDGADELSTTTFDGYSVLFSSTQYATIDRITVNYAKTLAQSLFCLIVRIPPVGQLALFDAMAVGCIPVIADDNFVLPFSEVLDWSKIAVRVRYADLEQSQVQFIFNRYFASLEKIVLTSLDILNERVFPYYSRTYFQWNDPNYVEHDFPSPPSLFYPTRSSTDIGFTAVIRGHDHFALLHQLLMDLHLVPSLRRIVVVWTNPNVSVPSAPLWPSLRVPLSLVPVDQPSRRFFPHAQITTEAVLSLERSRLRAILGTNSTCIRAVESKH
ncbi:hypothetical protein AHF37_07506 [Paragonimus kellicotti]|nr:hypothetical protein AHF37_07506 [Paragonimus kellicotti]